MLLGVLIQYPCSAYDLLSKKKYAQRAWVRCIPCRQRASRRVSWHDHTSVLWQNTTRFMAKRNTFCIKTPSILIQNAFRFHTKRPPFWYKMQLYKYVAVLRCSHSCPPTFQCWCPTAIYKVILFCSFEGCILISQNAAIRKVLPFT